MEDEVDAGVFLHVRRDISFVPFWSEYHGGGGRETWSYRARQRHTSRSQQLRTRGQPGRQHAIFGFGDKVQQVFDFLRHRYVFAVLDLVRVHGLGARAGADVAGSCVGHDGNDRII